MCNETDPENISLHKKSNQLAVPVFQYSYGIINSSQSEINVRHQNKKTPYHPQNVRQKPVRLENILVETRGRKQPDGLNQVHTATSVGHAEYVKCSRDDCIQFVNKPNNVSRTHLQIISKNRCEYKRKTKQQ